MMVFHGRSFLHCSGSQLFEGPKESCKEKTLSISAHLLRKTGLPSPRRCAPNLSLAAPMLQESGSGRRPIILKLGGNFRAAPE
ncbi:MAG: hypothetical protein R2773_05800 [Flavobacteriaceae bacterium]